MDFVSDLARRLPKYGFDHFGWASLTTPTTMDVYRAWLAEGHHATMGYLETHAELKAKPRTLSTRAMSAIVIAKSYAPHPYPTDLKLPAARTAFYARGRDYHVAFMRELELVAKGLALDYPREEFLCFTDAGPILERDLARRAGLGWVGKNTCLIHPGKGSLFFIGEIVTSLEINERAPVIADHCGTCTRCLDACPTGALERPRWLNANKCIAYWTIEAPAPAPPELRPKFGDWFFGCDICQTVCPWNEKVFGRERMRAETSSTPPDQTLVEDLRFILSSTNRALGRAFRHTPLLRARPSGLKRNALIVIANSRLRELLPEVERACETPALKEVAEWTRAQLRF